MLTFIVILMLICASKANHDGRELCEDFSNEWVVHLEGSSEGANILANDLGYENMGEIPGFENYFLLRKSDHPAILGTESVEHTRSLEEDIQVIFAQQLFNKKRVKRRFLNEDMRISDELLNLWEESRGTENVGNGIFNDPQWKEEWYLQEKLTRDGSGSNSLNVLECFERGFNGSGIKVVVLDDGLDFSHQDIYPNYDPKISWDYNSGYSGDPDPSPRKPENDFDYPNSHGTRCAGEIAMIPNNNICGVGVAYGAKIGAIRMLDGRIDDRVEGLSLKHAYDKVDIFTASWGPTDDGKTVEGPGHLALEAIKKGIEKGRDGKGIIYVWASGNGGVHEDSCNCDGYTSNMHTLSIGSVTSNGKFPWYGEKCSSTMAVTYSSGDNNEPKIATTDVNNGCTVGHTGTSASAPLAAGIFALALQANPKLTWRDMQHLVVQTSSSDGLEANTGWYRNAAGLEYNHRFGFGVIKANKLVEAALKFSHVDHQETCETSFEEDKSLLPGENNKINIDVLCPNIKYLEHVLVTLTLDAPNRGQIEVAIKSPSGDFSQLLSRRNKDSSSKGFKDWTFNTVHFWGTDPNGKFEIYVSHQDDGKSSQKATLKHLKLTLFGTSERPEIMVPTLFAEPQYQMDDFESFLAYENDRMELLWNAFA